MSIPIHKIVGSYTNVMLKMSSLRVMVKRIRRKKQQKEVEKQQHVIVTENNLFKGFTTEGGQNYAESLTVTVDGSTVSDPYIIR